MVAGLLLGAASTGCGRGEDGSTEASATSATGDEGQSTSGGATGDGATGGEASTGTETSTSTTTTAGSSTSSGEGGGEPPSGCEAYVSRFIACIADGDRSLYPEALAECEMGLLVYDELYGDECVDVVEAYQACFASLTCAEIDGDRACDAEGSAIMEHCTSEPGPLCAAYEAKVVLCTGDRGSNPGAECQTQIDMYSRYYGEACAQSVEDYYACLTALACGESGCDAEQEALLELCG